MTLNASTLADNIKNALGFSAYSTSAQNSGLASAIVAHLMTGVVTFLPGTVTGVAAPSPGPLSNGAASGGTILLVPSALEAALVAVFGTSTPQILGMADAISIHFMTGMVSFATGNITGVCTNTPLSPGTFTGVGANGTISGLSGSTLATQMATGISQAAPTPQLTAMCNAIVSHVQGNAVVTLPLVVGVTSAGGGPLAAGAATGGLIT
jgi:hypothetical protein